VQYPGHEDRIGEPCLEDLHLLADQLAGAIGGLGPTPLILFGHSLGGAAAFEVALRLEEAGTAGLAGLIISGRPAPHAVTGPARRESDAELWAELARLGGTRPEVTHDERLREFFLPIVRSDFRMSDRYRPAPGRRVRCDLAAYRGRADADADGEQVARWADLTTGSFRLCQFDGGHFYLTPLHHALVRELSTDIHAALGVPPGEPRRHGLPAQA
jgi:pyochelin biosynthetic protein PchC